MKWIIIMLCFGIIGSIGMIIDFGITWWLREKIKVNQYFANAIGFILAVINNYILNKYWTFHEKGPISFQQFTIFIIISIIGLSLNSYFLYFFTKNIKIKFYWSKLLATGLVFFWNFLINDIITFR